MNIMPDPSPPSLPSLNHLPQVGIDCACGLLFGAISQVNPVLTMTIFGIRGLAHNLFYVLVNAALKGTDLKSHRIYIATGTCVNIAFLVVLREFNFIGRLLAGVLALVGASHLIRHVSYIQSEEKKLQMPVIPAN